MILDLSGVDFMDTTALAVIVSHWRRQVEADGMFLLAGARYRYTKALWITGLADRLPMYDNLDEALTATRPDPAPPRDGAVGQPGQMPPPPVRPRWPGNQRYQRPRDVPSPIRTRNPSSQITRTMRAIHHRM